MRFRRAVPRVARHLCLHTLILVLLASSAGLASRAWAQPSQSSSSQATALESIKTSVDEIEAVLGREDTTAEALAQLREKLNARDRCPARGHRRARAQGTRGRGASQAARPRARKGCTAGEPGDRQRTRRAHGELQRARWSFERGEGPLGQDRSVERARGAAATCSLCAGAVCAHRERVRSFLLDRTLIAHGR